MLNITFTPIGTWAKNEPPKPASRVIPDWYKDIESYVNKEKKPTGQGQAATTIKKCMPVFAVNFPFVLNDVTFERMIPKGTPIAQVIPFKRDSFEMKIGEASEMAAQAAVVSQLNTKFFDRYKTMFRKNKEYR
jgi:hypothetical protein